MSIGAGSFTLTRLQILDKPGALDFKKVLKSLKAGAIVPIEMDECVEERIGWCHPYTGEPDFSDANDWLNGEHLVFGLRVDQKKVPGTLFKLQLRGLLEEIERTSSESKGNRAKQGKGDEGQDSSSLSGEKGRKMRDLARERVKMELLKRTLPSIRLVEVVWNFQSNEIWITSSSQSVLDAFDALFSESFSLPYVFKTCGTLGIDYDRLLLGVSDEYNDSETVEKLTQCVPWGALGQSESVQKTEDLPFLVDEEIANG